MGRSWLLISQTFLLRAARMVIVGGGCSDGGKAGAGRLLQVFRAAQLSCGSWGHSAMGNIIHTFASIQLRTGSIFLQLLIFG